MISPEKARLRLGLNQQQMADAMGVHRQTWVKWERGEREMNASARRLLAILVILNDAGMLSLVIPPPIPGTKTDQANSRIGLVR